MLEDKDTGEKRNVQPDIMVICDKSKFTKAELISEISGKGILDSFT
jgi:hypothetical protein